MSKKLNKLTITVATTDDLQEWALARSILWPDMSKEEHLNEILDQSKSNCINFICRVKKEFCGFLEASIRTYANGCTKRPVLFLEGIWVKPELQRKGIGMKLLNELENWANKNGYSEICSDTQANNQQSISAHQKWDFKETERVIYFRKAVKK